MKETKRAKKQPNGTTPGPRSIYLGELYKDIQKQAERLGRSVSWTIRAAWQLALPEIQKMASKPKDMM